MSFIFRWRKFSHLEPSSVFPGSLTIPGPDFTHIHTLSPAESRRQSHILSTTSIIPCSSRISTTSTIPHSSRRLSLCGVTQQILTTRRQSCMPVLGIRDNITRQKTATDTIEEVLESPAIHPVIEDQHKLDTLVTVSSDIGNSDIL